MPTYVYRREDGSTFEKVQRMNDDALTECPDTGQKVRRVISGGEKPQIKGWSPDKEAKKEKWIKENPGGTTLPEYKKKIDENTEKARKQKAKLKRG